MHNKNWQNRYFAINLTVFNNHYSYFEVQALLTTSSCNGAAICGTLFLNKSFFRLFTKRIHVYTYTIVFSGRFILIFINPCACILFSTYTETKNTKYLEFVDCTDEVKEEYLNGSMDCFKGTNGVIYSHYSRIGRSFTIIDGVVYQNCAGPLKHPKRTKKAKRMTALPNYPFKKLYKSWQEWTDIC